MLEEIMITAEITLEEFVIMMLESEKTAVSLYAGGIIVEELV